jgi:hypothetical protein
MLVEGVGLRSTPQEGHRVLAWPGPTRRAWRRRSWATYEPWSVTLSLRPKTKRDIADKPRHEFLRTRLHAELRPPQSTPKTVTSLLVRPDQRHPSITQCLIQVRRSTARRLRLLHETLDELEAKGLPAGQLAVLGDWRAGGSGNDVISQKLATWVDYQSLVRKVQRIVSKKGGVFDDS